jgi:hypothetical protein
MTARNPNEDLNLRDAGDNTQMRFHYQNAYAALEAARLLNANSLYSEIYCEQEEDILLKRKDGRFSGVQVKTKDGTTITIASTPIQEALQRFIVLETTYPEKFVEYIIVTNCKIKGKLEDYISQVIITSGTNNQIVTQVFGKVKFKTWATLRDYEVALVDQIATIINARHHRLDTLKKLTYDLLDIALNASRQTSASAQSIYYQWLVDPQVSIVDATIKSKTINLIMVQEIVNKWLNSTLMLEGTNPITLCDLPRGLSRMQKKMAKGGISCENIALMKDLNNSTFKLLSEWGYSYGKKKTDERIEDLRLMVQRECQTAYDLCYNNSSPFGKEMLREVRKRLQVRESEIKQKYIDCSIEHLEGMTGILTEKCTVWWSEQFEIGGEDVGPTSTA